jgi:hypothetical protein
VALPASGQSFALLRVSVNGRSLEGEPVQLERAGLALPVMSHAAFDSLVDDELVRRRLIELAAADAMSRMRAAASAGDWTEVDRLLESASRQFAGNDWVASVLEAMRSIAATRERERMMKEAMYSSGKLRSRLAGKDEEAHLSVDDAGLPAYLRRKVVQGKGDV